ncbi:site-specific DNA-methyltransferase [Leuconostoc sp. C2]|uniref:DNA-methyltransferase n=1 Tax=Leuconostoc sp. (strain C2) TaxID=979982 RepID=UPI0002FD7657|nr:site-specific DNA-methyltransferase [Leuconostoc sp. C2]
MMKLINDNNLNALLGIPDNSVDLILTDPPYNISRKNNFESLNRAGIDFGDWDKNADLLTWIDKVPRIVKKGASIIIFNAWRNLGDIAERLEKNGFVVKDIIRWEKTNPMPRNRDRRYIVDYEFAIWAVEKHDKWTFHRQSDKYDRSEIRVPITSKAEKMLGSHPTQKPIKLMEELLLQHSNENDIVLDPFMGSGSTGVACQNLNREFMGIELDETYFKIAENRIREA